jgi:hypothetical protein
MKTLSLTSSASYPGIRQFDPNFNPPWWDTPTIFEGVSGDPYAVHVVYDLSHAPSCGGQSVPEGGSLLAYVGLGLLGLGLARQRWSRQPTPSLR